MVPACDLPGEDLIAYTDGELGGAHLEYVETHVKVCPICRERLAAFEETARILRENTPLVDDPEARARLLARLEQEAARRTRIQPPRAMMLLIATLLLAGAAMVVWPRTDAVTAGFPLGRFIRDLTVEQLPRSLRRLPGQRPSGQPAGVGEPAPFDPGQLSFLAVAPAELPAGLTLSGRSTPARDLFQVMYQSRDGLVVRLSQALADASPATVPSSARLLTVDSTRVLWQPDPQPDSILRMVWVRDGVLFELAVVERQSRPLALSDARRIVAILIARQDAGDHMG